MHGNRSLTNTDALNKDVTWMQHLSLAVQNRAIIDMLSESAHHRSSTDARSGTDLIKIHLWRASRISMLGVKVCGGALVVRVWDKCDFILEVISAVVKYWVAQCHNYHLHSMLHLSYSRVTFLFLRVCK